ncbi:alpha/beta fold hydrolase [Massilia sp. METH4]|uniref:alpha/beta fold hydrolase n=1 Tax=Massilia sp. METH4 TaxID=3123041 RepID=UPI0030CD7DC5
MRLETAMPLQVDSGVANGTAFSVYGEGAPVVLIHGVGMAQRVWEPQIAALAVQHQVIVYDMLGHGDSKLPTEGATLADYAYQLAQLLDHLDIAEATVIGHSMGALVALEFAVLYPKRTVKVAALNAVYRRTPDQRRSVMERAHHLVETGVVATLESTIARWFGDPVPEALKESAALTRSLLSSVDLTGYARTYRLFASQDEAHVARLPSLAVPALFMTAEFDSNSTPAMSRAMAEATPGSKCVVIPGERHMMGLTAPEEVNGHLLRFIDTPVL